jgi:hypothetical protein
MTLPYRQERLLRRTDRALSESDPDLAAMLSIFARITAADGLPAWEQLRPGLTWIWGVLLWPVAAAAFIVVFVAGGGSRAAHPGGPTGSDLRPLLDSCSAADRSQDSEQGLRIRGPAAEAARPCWKA